MRGVYLSRGQEVSLIYFILEVLYLALQYISSFMYLEGVMVTVLFCLVFFLHMDVPLFQHHILKDGPFSSELPQCFCQKYFEYLYEALILASVLLQHLYLYDNIILSGLLQVLNILKSDNVRLPTLFFPKLFGRSRSFSFLRKF